MIPVKKKDHPLTRFGLRRIMKEKPMHQVFREGPKNNAGEDVKGGNHCRQRSMGQCLIEKIGHHWGPKDQRHDRMNMRQSF